MITSAARRSHTSTSAAHAPSSVAHLDPATEPAFAALPYGVRVRVATRPEFVHVRALHREAMRPSLESALGSWDDAAQGRWLDTHLLQAGSGAVTWLLLATHACLGSEVVGTASWRPGVAHDRLELLQLGARWRGRGVGTAFLHAVTNAADARCRGLGLAVLRGSRAGRLYPRHGFVLTSSDPVQDHFERPTTTTPAVQLAFAPRAATR